MLITNGSRFPNAIKVGLFVLFSLLLTIQPQKYAFFFNSKIPSEVELMIALRSKNKNLKRPFVAISSQKFKLRWMLQLPKDLQTVNLFFLNL